MVQTQIVQSLSQISNVLNCLGSPPAGRIRVYRGQTRECFDPRGGPCLVPALLRKDVRQIYDPNWLGAMSSYVGNTLGAIGIDYTVRQLWAPALIQHYGPGSHYLDVTGDLRIAVWFSLHRYHQIWLALKEGKDANDLQDLRQPVAWFTEATNDIEAPTIYVMDVEAWDGRAIPRHGQLVDLLAMAPGTELAKQAPRISHQSAALIYADPNHPDGPDLSRNVVARLALAHPLKPDDAAKVKFEVGQLFPPPKQDAMYRALITYPSYMKFEPPRLEQSLPIPLVLTSAFPGDRSPNMRKLGGSGSYDQPLRPMFRLHAGPDLPAIAELHAYLSDTTHITPPVFHRYLANSKLDPCQIGDQVFLFEDALPIFLETPLWTFTPSTRSNEGLAQWIQSALPLGIAPQIGGRGTNNVYIEICPLDVMPPGGSVGKDLLRGVWVSRLALNYTVTMFRRGDDIGTYSCTFQYRFDPIRGVFERIGSADSLADKNTQNVIADSLKALFLTLLILRELSPGYKPPAMYDIVIDKTNYVPTVLLEPQLGIPHIITTLGYVVPKALDGTPYIHTSGSGLKAGWLPTDRSVALAQLKSFLPLVKSAPYIAWAGATLAEMHADRRDFDAALEVLQDAKAAAASTNDKFMEARLQQLAGKIFVSTHQWSSAVAALSSSLRLFEKLNVPQGDNAVRESRDLLADVEEFIKAAPGTR